MKEGFKITGTIKSISPITEVSTGKKLTFRIDNGATAPYNLVEFELYKGTDYVSHVEKFGDYNKVGDNVEVEFNLKTYNWKPEDDNKIFTSLSCWKVEKVTDNVSPVGNDPIAPEPGDLPF